MIGMKSGIGARPLVDVCIPTYNRCEQLKTAVWSVLNGTYEHVAIIISDNASSDGTSEWCESICATDGRISYFRHEVNQGPIINFEFARSKANGKYFMWLGDDDYLSPDYIEVCVAELEADESLALVSGVGAYHRGDNKTTKLGNIFNLGSQRPWLRVAKYLWLVDENSIFYGIYRSEMVEHCVNTDRLWGDCIFVANVVSRGKAMMVSSIHIYREYGNGASSSVARMVEIIGAPAWQARYPKIAIGMNLVRYIGVSNDAKKSKKMSMRCVRCAVTFVVVIKMLRSSARIFSRVFSRAPRRPIAT